MTDARLRALERAAKALGDPASVDALVREGARAGVAWTRWAGHFGHVQHDEAGACYSTAVRLAEPARVGTIFLDTCGLCGRAGELEALAECEYCRNAGADWHLDPKEGPAGACAACYRFQTTPEE